LPNVGPYIYTTLAFLALLGAPYIYEISSLRVKRSTHGRSLGELPKSNVAVCVLSEEWMGKYVQSMDFLFQA